MSDYPRVLWLDTETTGLEDDALLLEVSGVVMGDDLSTVHGSFSRVVHYEPDVLDAHLGAYVRAMHTENGLLLAVKQSDAELESVLTDMDHWLDDLEFGKEPNSVPLAGSGVHADRNWLMRLAPWLARRFTYWAYDVGQVKRFARDYLPKGPDLVALCEEMAGVYGGLAHRSFDDVARAIEEAKVLRNFLRVDAPQVASGPLVG